MRTVSLSLLALGLALSALVPALAGQVPVQYSLSMFGAEVITFLNPPLAYISNLRYDPPPPGVPNGVPRIFFIADKSSPNLYTATFLPSGLGPMNFSSTGVSQFAPQELSTYVCLVAGIALASPLSSQNFSLFNGSQLLTQGASVPMDPTQNGKVMQKTWPGFQLMGVAIDPKSDVKKPTVFLAGSVAYEDPMGNSYYGLAVVKAAMDDQLGINFNYMQDMLTPSSLINVSCYDIYTSAFKPRIFPSASNNFFIVAFPGRCSLILRVSYDPNSPLNSSTTLVASQVPVDLSTQYVSSYAYDSLLDTIYYTVKTYQKSGAVASGWNCKVWVPVSTNFTLDVGESEPILSMGDDVDVTNNPQRYLFVTAAGANKVVRMNVQSGFANASLAYASLGELFNSISSTLYVAPHFYFGTYEPNAALGRIHSDNFCPFDCGINSYCWGKGCLCVPGYGQDFNSIDPLTGLPKCVSNSYLTIKNVVKSNSDASVALGIMLAITTFIGGVGWYFWWRARQNAYRPL